MITKKKKGFFKRHIVFKAPISKCFGVYMDVSKRYKRFAVLISLGKHNFIVGYRWEDCYVDEWDFDSVN